MADHQATPITRPVNSYDADARNRRQASRVFAIFVGTLAFCALLLLSARL